MLEAHKILKPKFTQQPKVIVKEEVKAVGEFKCKAGHSLVSITENPYNFKRDHKGKKQRINIVRCDGCKKLIRSNIMNHCGTCSEDYCEKCVHYDENRGNKMRKQSKEKWLRKHQRN